ncbi:MAG: SpoIID/LytB domain-containing protein [Planctomycetaceae bacterium]
MRFAALPGRLLALFFLPLVACAPAPLLEVQKPLLDREPMVRVLLKAASAGASVRVTAADGIEVEAGATRFRTQTPVGLSLRDGQLDVAGNGARAARVILRPLGAPLEVAGRAYAGELWIYAASRVLVVNHLPLELYTLGVLRGELPLPRIPAAAAGAQAIAIRSYALHYLAQRGARSDLDDTTTFQVYVGLQAAPDDANLQAGVVQTRALYLAFDGKPLKAYFHSTCGGHTTDPKTAMNRELLAPLRGAPCDSCRGSRYWRWEATIPDAAILKAAGLPSPLRGFAVGDRAQGGRAATFVVTAREGARTFHAGEFRIRLGASFLRSTLLLAIERAGEGWRVAGGGWGHGVGLCQLGAIGKATVGKTALEIVRAYYPGASVDRAY